MTVALLPPKMDFVFKRIFGNENHPNVLISFLNAVLNPVDPIKSVRLKDTTIEKSHLEDKYSRLDVKAMTNKGEHINIEIQLKDEYNMIKRSLYYWSKLYEGQLENGENYQKLSRTICINLLDFNLLNHDKFHSAYRLKDCETNEELTDVMELHFIEFKKMKNVKRVEEVKNKLEAWLYFINQPDSELVQELEKDVNVPASNVWYFGIDGGNNGYSVDSIYGLVSSVWKDVFVIAPAQKKELGESALTEKQWKDKVPGDPVSCP